MARLVERLRSEPRYGLDTEFLAERTYWPRLCLVQVSGPDHVALVDPLACDVRALSELVEGPGTMVSHAAAADLPILERACGTRPSVLFDTQTAAGFIGMGTPSLGNLVSGLLDVKLDKSEQLTDWSRRPLSAAALDYAAADVAYLFAATDVLEERLEAAGRLKWAIDECEALRCSTFGDNDPDTAWWRIKGARSLRGKNVGVAQAVAAWREHRARELDRPPRFVLSELALVAIATRPPRNVEALARVRGADSLPPATAKAVLDAVAAGEAMPSSELRRPPRRDTDPDLDAAAGVMMAWSAQVAAREGLEGRLLATRDDIKELVHGRASRLDDGWRAELLGVDLRALLDGRAALRLADGGRRVELDAAPR
jgi:ribonuclease D